MSDRDGLPRRSRLPGGLLGMLGLLAVAELYVAAHDADFTRFYICDWAAAGRASRREVGGCGVLCFGDSLVKFGVAPRVLERRLGLAAYNLAVCGGQAPSSYFLLRRALDAGARPAALVVDFMPHLLLHGPRHNMRQWPELLDAGESFELAWQHRHSGFFASLWLERLFPSIKAREQVREAIRALMRGTQASSRSMLKAYRRNWEVNRGSQVCPVGRKTHETDDLDRWENYPTAWRPSRVNAAYMRRFLELAGARGIPVFWVLPPLTPQAQARREALGVESRYDWFARAIQGCYPFVTVVDGRRAGLGDGAFADAIHLNALGAAALSEALADVLGRSLAGPRREALWIDLPRVRAATAAVDLEDVTQSALALRAAGRGRRR